MIFEKTEVSGFEAAFRGMRNPMNSWDRGDNGGPNDLVLADRLISSGPEHAKFLRQIMVSVDITAPLYWWKEFDTYKVGTTANSCSTMHKLASTEITPQLFELDNSIITEVEFVFFSYLEALRCEFNKTKDILLWRRLIQLLPNGWLQKRTVTMSYANIRNMVHQRKGHKLTEWSVDFMRWVETLPLANELLLSHQN